MKNNFLKKLAAASLAAEPAEAAVPAVAVVQAVAVVPVPAAVLAVKLQQVRHLIHCCLYQH